MKLRFNRQEMAEALSAVCNLTTARTTKDILKCVRVEARSDVLLVSATDLEIGLRCAVSQVEVEETGDTLVNADTLNKIVRECADDLLSVETVGNELHLRGVGSHFKIVTQAPTDFPPIPTMEGDPDFTVGSEELRRFVEWTVFASARESTRYAINGVLWEVEGDKLTLAATDGRRLSTAHGALTSRAAKSIPQAIVPGRALSLFARLPAEAGAIVGVRITANQLLLKIGGAMMSSALVEGHFPKYQDVIPSDCDRVVQLDTVEFHGALRRAALLTNEESKGVRLSFTEGNLTLSSRAPEQGEATISLPVEYSGEPVDIGFNPVFLSDALRGAHTDQISFEFRESNRPGVIRLSDDFVHVIMPVNLSSS